MAEDYGYYSEATGQFMEAPKKEVLRIQFPFALRFAIIWTLFFIIIGIGIQYYQSMSPTLQPRSFIDISGSFFGTEYAGWFRSFGSFVNVTEYESGMQVFTSIMGQWYYFFYTGGLLALIWGLISWIVNIEIVFSRRRKLPNIPPQNQPSKPQIQKVVVEKQVPVPVYIEKPRPMLPPQKEIEVWLEEGLFLLSEGRVYEAESMYEQIKRYYNPDQDNNQQTYKRILDFYYEIMERRK